MYFYILVASFLHVPHVGADNRWLRSNRGGARKLEFRDLSRLAWFGHDPPLLHPAVHGSDEATSGSVQKATLQLDALVRGDRGSRLWK